MFAYPDRDALAGIGRETPPVHVPDLDRGQITDAVGQSSPFVGGGNGQGASGFDHPQAVGAGLTASIAAIAHGHQERTAVGGPHRYFGRRRVEVLGQQDTGRIVEPEPRDQWARGGFSQMHDDAFTGTGGKRPPVGLARGRNSPEGGRAADQFVGRRRFDRPPGHIQSVGTLPGFQGIAHQHGIGAARFNGRLDRRSGRILCEAFALPARGKQLDLRGKIGPARHFDNLDPDPVAGFGREGPQIQVAQGNGSLVIDPVSGGTPLIAIGHGKIIRNLGQPQLIGSRPDPVQIADQHGVTALRRRLDFYAGGDSTRIKCHAAAVRPEQLDRRSKSSAAGLLRDLDDKAVTRGRLNGP